MYIIPVLLLFRRADFRKDSFPSPSAFVVHGMEATGKTLILKELLERSKASYSWLPCHECITPRHLTERIAAMVTGVVGGEETSLQRCETVSTLAVYLQQMLRESERKHFLVGIWRVGCCAPAKWVLRFWIELTSKGTRRRP